MKEKQKYIGLGLIAAAVIAGILAVKTVIFQGESGRGQESQIQDSQSQKHFASYQVYENRFYMQNVPEPVSKKATKLPVDSYCFAIEDGRIYYVNEASAPASGEERGKVYEIRSCDLNGKAEELLASDLVLSMGEVPVITESWLYYVYGDEEQPRGYAQIDLSDGTKIKFPYEQLQNIRQRETIGFCGESWYYTEIAEAMGTGQNEQGEYVHDAAVFHEIRVRNMKLGEEKFLTSYENWDQKGGLAEAMLYKDKVYCWILDEKPEEAQNSWQYRLEVVSLPEQGNGSEQGEAAAYESVHDQIVRFPIRLTGAELGTVNIWNDYVYYIQDGILKRYPTEEKQYWGEPEQIYGNLIYQEPEENREEAVTAWEQECSSVGDLKAWNEELYITADYTLDSGKDGGNGDNAGLYRVSLEDGSVEVLDTWFTP